MLRTLTESRGENRVINYLNLKRKRKVETEQLPRRKEGTRKMR